MRPAAMNEDFLHRIRVQPSPQFLERLKAKLDRQPSQEPRARWVRSLAAGLLIGVSALAIASLALRGEFAGWRWTGRGVTPVGSEPMGAGRTASAASKAGAKDTRNGWGPNPWASASQRAPEKSRRKPAGDTAAVVPIPQSGTATPATTTAQYSNGGAAPVQAPPVRLRIATSPEADVLTTRIVQRFVHDGYTQPEVSVEPTDQLLANLCTANGPFRLVTVPRPMNATENAKCGISMHAPLAADVKLVSEAVVLVRSKLYGALPLSVRDIYLALAKTIPDPANPGALKVNHLMTWNEVNPTLPPDRIEVLGPALDSELGRAFLTIVMERGCKSLLAALPSLPREAPCSEVRDDGVYATAPEGYPALLQRLQMLPTVLALVPYGTLQTAADALVASPVDDVEPTSESIASGRYPGSRTLHLYFNRDYGSQMMRRFLEASLDAVDRDYPFGAFVPLPRAERAEIRTNAFNALMQ
jgi:phosphate transport system substrate-binding protein